MSFIKELQRRNVIRVAIAYAVAAWLLIEITATTFPILKLPDWSVTLVTVLVLMGFPLALILAWAYELTPEGIKKEKEVDRSQSITHQTGRKLDFIIIGALAVALIFFASTHQWVNESADDPDIAEAAAGEVPVVAVLPLKALSTEDEGIFLASGLHDDLLTRLARLEAFRVISRTSVMEYASTAKNLRQIGEELGADYIVEGGLQAIGGRVHINAQLIDAATDEHLWAEAFDRELTTANLFEVQAEIAAAIADALRTALSPHDVEFLKGVPTQNLDAYRAYLTGTETQTNITQPALLATVEAFRRAVELDPEFADAWANLALSLIRRYWEEGGESDAAPDVALRKDSSVALKRAQALNPDGVATLVAEAYFRYYGFRDYSTALIILGRAEAVAPYDDTVIALRGFLLRRLGRLGDAADALLRAKEANPNDRGLLREATITLLAAGRCDEASALATAALDRYPSDNGILTSSAWVRLFCDDDIQAGRELVVRVDITTVFELRNVVLYLIYAGDLQAAVRVLTSVGDQWGEDPIVRITIANRMTWLYRETGQQALAQASLRSAVEASESLSDVGATALAELTMTAALHGDVEVTLDLGRRTLASLPEDAYLQPIFRYRVVAAYAVAGAEDEALVQLEKMLREPGGDQITPLMKDPYLASLRDHSQFQRVMTSVLATDEMP